MRNLGVLLAWAALGGLASSCGGSSDTSPGPAGGACDQLAQTTCDKLAQCAAPLFQQAYPDSSTCVSRLKPLCTLALQAPGVTATDADLAACVQQYASSSCDAYLSPAICTLPPGTLANGSACGNNLQCESELCDNLENGCGVCAPRVPDGGSCAADPLACEPGSACTLQTKVCAKYVSAGGACSDARCDPSLTCISGTCQKWLEKGDACDPQNALLSGCDLRQALYCDPTSKVCTQITFAGPGATCGNVNGAYVICGGGSTCVISGTSGTGTCVAPLGDGAACGGTTPSNCTSPAECIDNVCKIPDPSACK